ncbi:MAG: MgtC/SapB family protein [Burkholderiales bacterium]|nr:MgtC/SapB family protein [Burkholderiales bacterium]
MNLALNADTLTSLALALGLGLVIGIERERSKGRGPTRRFAGIRTFALACLTGAGAQVLGQDWLTAVAGALVAGLALVSHFKDRSRDPGVTTEIALFLTFLLGLLSVPEPVLASALGVTVAVLLVARVPLQRFSTQVLGEQELRDALLLAASALVVLPLAPNQALLWLGGINLRVVWQLVVLIMAVQALGHVALRLFGARLGLPLSGLVAGFVSSTATIATMGTRAARHPELRTACVAGAWFSTVSTALQVMLIAGLLYPAGLHLIAPAMGSALLMALLLGLAAFRRSPVPQEETPAQGRAFSLRQSILLALLFTGIAAVVAWLQQGVGTLATLAATALAGFADAHSSAAAVMGLAARGEIDPFTMLTAVLLAFSTNNLSKIVAAYMAGGARYGSIVSAGLVLVALAAWACWGWLRLSH